MVCFVYSEPGEDQQDGQNFYNGYSLYSSATDVMQPVDVFNAVLNTKHDAQVVCQQKPVGIKDTATFLIDTTKLRHFEDIKADDVGSWVHKGRPVRFYTIARLASGEVYGAQLCEGAEATYKLTRIYYHHKGTPEFRKTIFYVHGMYEFDSYILISYLLCVIIVVMYPM